MLGIEYPILEASMGMQPKIDLTVAVSEAGGLGVVCHGRKRIFNMDPKDKTLIDIREVVSRIDKPFGVNTRVAKEERDPKYFGSKVSDVIDMILEERKRNERVWKNLKAIITSAGQSADFTERIKKEGLLHIHKV